MREIYKNEGFLGFWKGLYSPLIARTPISASLFVS